MAQVHFMRIAPTGLLFPPLLFALAGLPAMAGNPGPTAAEFAVRALAALPVEQSHDFRKALSEGPLESLRRDPRARPAPTEMAIPAEGWSLVVSAGAGPILRQAAQDFRDYLDVAMRVRVALDDKGSLEGWA